VEITAGSENCRTEIVGLRTVRQYSE